LFDAIPYINSNTAIKLNIKTYTIVKYVTRLYIAEIQFMDVDI